MAERVRLDIALEQRGLVQSRARARDAILRGTVRVNGIPALKPAVLVGADDVVAIDDPAGAYAAATVRRMDPATGLWSIWWIDSRFSEIAPPVVGRFESGVGTFRGKDVLRGQPIDVRFLWSALSETGARWEQAFSGDGGIRWETNWVMEFMRAG